MFTYVPWKVYCWLGRHTSLCWAQLVSLKLDGWDRDRSYGGEPCRRESATHQHRTCYCGKFRNGTLRGGKDE